MARIFDGRLNVDYAQAYVEPYTGPDILDRDQAFRGQNNGICGGAIPEFLFLATGLHLGDVGLTVDVLDAAPALDESWEEIVEVSFFMRRRRVGLTEWGEDPFWEIPLSPETTYRVRYCARGMDRGKEVDTPEDDEAEPVDYYSLAFWPAEPSADTIIRQTSQIAAYYHRNRSR